MTEFDAGMSQDHSPAKNGAKSRSDSSSSNNNNSGEAVGGKHFVSKPVKGG